MATVFVYITVESTEAAGRIARALVEERLAAGANMIDGMRSIYRWRGKIEEAAEVIVIAKTRDDLLDSLTERVRSLHSYECPCVVGLPVVGGNPDYLEWIASETRESAG
jgi:periplasmic divalent cation tolerance protein